MNTARSITATTATMTTAAMSGALAPVDTGSGSTTTSAKAGTELDEYLRGGDGERQRGAGREEDRFELFHFCTSVIFLSEYMMAASPAAKHTSTSSARQAPVRLIMPPATVPG